jgi:hypothetical protein
MNILMISENDPAGMAIAFKKAINKNTDHRCRLITTTSKYNFNFETDLHIPDATQEEKDKIPELITEADLIHFHILADEEIVLDRYRVKDFFRGKEIIHHHHGHPHFRANPDFYRDKYKRLRRRALVSTPDLLKKLPEAAYLPNIVPVNDPLLAPASYAEKNLVKIGQSPTRKELKDTVLLQSVFTSLQKNMQNINLELDIIENCAHLDCLNRKNNCQIIFDHMQGYYGVSSLESLSQGKPVIAGLDEWNKKHITKFARTTQLPWLIAHDRAGLEKILSKLIEEPDYRQEKGKYSREFMTHFWNEELVVNKLIDFYNE